MNLASHIEELKRLTWKKDISLSEPFEYFMKYFAENPEAMQRSKAYKENLNFFKALIMPMLDFMNLKQEVAHWLLMQIKPFDFVHGIALLSNGLPLTLYYFEEILIGMAAIPVNNENTNFFRLSATIVKNISDSSFAAPKGSSTVH